MTAVEARASHQEKAKLTTYYVNGESQTTDQRKLTPRQILTNAGLTPPEDWRLLREQGHHELTDLDKEESIHQDERFLGLFKGVTPTS